MTSKSDAISKSYYNTDDKWVIDICQNFLSPNKDLHDDDDDGVSICKVPKWLSSEKPEAFIPQFVGLGPYHHYPELTMTDKLKLATTKRALNHFDNGEEEKLQQLILKALLSRSDFKPFDHIDMMSSTYNHQTLLYIITVDGLFLLGLITANSQENYYFLSGKKHGMAVVHPGAAQMTMDFIIRDVFMVENQIPTYFLQQIAEVLPTKSNEIQSHGGDLGLSMKRFCKALCPFVHHEHLSKNPKAHYHLLDLMYHLIVPELKPELEPVPVAQSKPDPKPQPQPNNDEFPCWVWCIGIICLPLIVVICWVCILFGILILFLGILFWILKSLFHMVAKPLKFIRSMLETFYDFLSKTDEHFSFLNVKQWTEVIKERQDTSQRGGGEQDMRPAVTIPSVMELHNVGIHFRPSEAGISSIDFSVTNCQFSLPVIKLDANSEIIIKNLVAYELLTRSKDLILTRYVEIMRAIIKTPNDVKMLVYEKIIHTDLSDEVVVQLFNEMSKSTRPSKTPKLDQVINKVITKFESTQTLNKLLAKYIYSSWKFFTVLGGVIFLFLTAAQTYCDAFGCAKTSN